MLSVPLVLQAASVDLDLAPMSVEATAPEGGVECPAIDDETPAAPVIQSPADGDVTNDSTPEFIGLAEPGTTVVVTDGEDNEICTDVADINGGWSCTPTVPIADGEDTYTATATAEGGNTSPEATVTFEVDTVTTVELDNPADGSTTNDLSPPVSGTGEPSATITVTEGGTEVCTTTVTPGGTWSCTPTAPLGAGAHTFTATATDGAGNTATATTTFAIDPDGDDTTAPEAPIIDPGRGLDDHRPTPEFSGTAEPGSTVVVTDAEGNQVCTDVAEAGMELHPGRGPARRRGHLLRHGHGRGGQHLRPEHRHLRGRHHDHGGHPDARRRVHDRRPDARGLGHR